MPVTPEKIALIRNKRYPAPPIHRSTQIMGSTHSTRDSVPFKAFRWDLYVSLKEAI